VYGLPPHHQFYTGSMVVRVSVYLFSPRARWTTLFLFSAMFVTLTWILPFLDQHYPIESGQLMAWPSSGLSRITGSRAAGKAWSATTHVHRKRPTADGRRNTTSVLNGPPMEFFRGTCLVINGLHLFVVIIEANCTFSLGLRQSSQ